MTKRTATEDLLVAGLMDWSDASWVDGTVDQYRGGKTRDRRLYALGMIADLIVDGLVTAGDVDDEGTFRQWEGAPGEVIVRIVRAWGHEWDDRRPELWSFFQLANTEAGDKVARGVLLREGRRA